MPNTEPDLLQLIALTAAFNEHGEVLLLKRPPDVHCGGLWGFPGGKVSVDENPIKGAVREFEEETGLTGKLWRHLGKSRYAYDDRMLFYFIYGCRCDDISGLKAESEHAWVALDALEDYPMPEGNTTFLHLIRDAAHFFAKKT